MNFCTPEQHAEFISQVPLFEQMLVNDGISLTKLWFSVTQSEQRTRFTIRQVDPVRQWKLSPPDLASLDKWDAYTAAKEDMFELTDTDEAPWTVVKSNDKKRARINAMRHVLGKFDYDNKDHDVVGIADPLIVGHWATTHATRSSEAASDRTWPPLRLVPQTPSRPASTRAAAPCPAA